MAAKSLGETMRGHPFVMVPLQPDGPVLTALREGRLHPRDLALLMVLIHNMDPLTGRVWMAGADLAAAMGHRTPCVVLGSIRRLKREGLVAKGLDRRNPRRWFWCVNPMAIACSGGSLRRWKQIDQFAMATDRLEPGRRRRARSDQPIAAA